MKNANIILMFLLSSIFLLASCNAKVERTEIPKNAVGTFSFVKGPNGKFSLKVFNKNGKPVEFKSAMDKKAQHAGKPGGNPKVTFEFINGSCSVLVCMPGRPCFPVVIDPVNDCPAF